MPFTRTGEIPNRKRRHPVLPGLAVREKDESEVRWLMSYSDFMMQLVCRFILLYSVSSVDISKAVSLAQAWRDEVGVGEVRLPSAGRKPSVPLTSVDLNAAIHELQIMAGRHPGGGSLRILRSADGFTLQLTYGMFERGSDRPDAHGIQAADLIADILDPLRERTASMEIVGHASADEDKAMDLSLNRSASILRRLQRPESQHPLGGIVLVAAGRGAHHPVADYSEETGCRLNRRVEFVVRLNGSP